MAALRHLCNIPCHAIPTRRLERSRSPPAIFHGWRRSQGSASACRGKAPMNHDVSIMMRALGQVQNMDRPVTVQLHVHKERGMVCLRPVKAGAHILAYVHIAYATDAFESLHVQCINNQEVRANNTLQEGQHIAWHETPTTKLWTQWVLGAQESCDCTPLFVLQCAISCCCIFSFSQHEKNLGF